jgi:hypothetical protein
MLIISFSKPEILLNRKMKEKANDEQKAILVKNIRKIYCISIVIIETGAMSRYASSDWTILILVALIVESILLFKYSIPAIKENRKIINELKR